MNKKNQRNRGFTMTELLIGIFITSILVIVVNTFARDVFYMSYTLSDSMAAQIDARHVIGSIIKELREAAPSNLGAYPLAAVSDSSITFYSDTNNDGLEDQIRYFLNGTSLQRGIVVPSGSPLSYNQANEKITTLISNVVASSTQPIFQYYSSSYTGTGSSLSAPINISSVSLIKVTVIIDRNAARAPTQSIITSQVSLRNLKSNQ